MTEAGLKNVSAPTCNVADQPIENGSDARCFAQYMRIHALEASGGLTYSQMGRFLAASDPSNPAGTSDETAALKDDAGKPVANAARNTWVTETALTTALNVSYMAEQIALFGLIVGIALLLSGIGFIILALIVLGAGATKEVKAPAFKRAAASSRAGRQARRPAPSRAGRQAGGRAQPALHLPEHEGAAQAAPSAFPQSRRDLARRAPGSRPQRRASGRRDRAAQP